MVALSRNLSRKLRHGDAPDRRPVSAADAAHFGLVNASSPARL